MAIPSIQQKFIPAVSITAVPGITLRNLDSSGLRIEWSVQRDNTNKPDTGEVTIYNLSPANISVFEEAWQALQLVLIGQFGLSFTLAVGWNQVPEIIMQGDIVKFEPRIRTPTDVLTRWTIGDKMESMRDAITGRDWNNVNVATILEYLVSLPPSPDDIGGGGLGLIYLPESKALVTAAAAEIAGQGFVFYGSMTKGLNVKDSIDAVMASIGLEWRVHNGAFVAMRGGIINRPGPIISPSSGLIEHTTLDDGGIQFTALSDARFEPGIRCTVLDEIGVPIGAPSYRVESTSFAGSTDEDSLMEVVGRKPL